MWPIATCVHHGLSVSVDGNHVSCKNGRTDRDAVGVFMQGYVLSGGRILQGKRQFWGIETSPDRRCKNVQIKIKKTR